MENSLTVNASVISTIRRLSFATLMTITFILMLNIVIPTIGWISEEAVYHPIIPRDGINLQLSHQIPKRKHPR